MKVWIDKAQTTVPWDYVLDVKPDRWMRDWVLTTWYCQRCGTQAVYQATGCGDDYYHAYSATCAACGHEHCCMPKWGEE